MILKYGELKRCHLERCFDFQVAAAGRVISEYNKVSGNHIVQGKARGSFEPKYLDIEPDRFLEAAQIMAAEQIIQIKQVIA